MDAQTLGALANIVTEAIAKAVGPLQDRIKELEARPAYDPDDVQRAFTNVNGRFELVAQSLPKEYDDTELRTVVEMLASDTSKHLAAIPKAYDDTELRTAVAETEKRLAAAHAAEVETMLGRIKDARYDDTALREELKRVEIDAGLTISELTQDVKQLTARPEPTTPIDGRDALHLEVLPAIDEQKSYQRGTYAKHAGGLWRSFEQTSGLRGWECIVNGVKSVDAVWHGKTLTHSIELSDGTVKAAVEMFPLMTYKHVFVPGDGYLAGDTVTWAGSLWHCNVTATKAKPGDGSTDWTLAVKKGRDGKEVVSVARGEPQPVRLNPLANLHDFIENGGR